MTDTATHAGQDVEVNGITIHYTTWGEAVAGHTVLLVHGLTGNGRAWSALAPRLASRGWSVVAPDLRGRGHSSKPAHGYGIPYHADDLLALCDALELPHVALVGHSLGAQIGLYLTALYGERIEKLVLIDAGGPFPEDTVAAITASLKRLETVYPSLAAYLETMSASPIHSWETFWEEYYRYDAEHHPDGSVTSRVPKAAIDEELRVLDLAIRLDLLPEQVRVPTLIARATVGMLGPDRGLILPVEQAGRLAEAIPDSRVVEVEGTNHYTILTSERLHSEVADFLDGARG